MTHHHCLFLFCFSFFFFLIGYIFKSQHPTTPTLLFSYFLLDIFFIYISNVILFPGFPSENPLSHPPLACSLTHLLLLPCPGIPLHWGIDPSQDQEPLLSLMSQGAMGPSMCTLYFSTGSVTEGCCHLFSWQREPVQLLVTVS